MSKPPKKPIAYSRYNYQTYEDYERQMRIWEIAMGTWTANNTEDDEELSDVPQTIDSLLEKLPQDIRENYKVFERHEASSQDGQAREIRILLEFKAQLRAIIEAEIAGIIGEFETERIVQQFKDGARIVEINPTNKLITEQRQRAAEAMERMFGKEGA